MAALRDALDVFWTHELEILSPPTRPELENTL